MAPAIRLASQGYILSGEEAGSLATAKNLARFPDSRRIFQRSGNFFKLGDRFIQPELARTLRRIAADPTSFYKGPMAAELAASIQKGGGLITTADLAAYQVKDRAPLTGSYRGYQIVTAPPPSAGGIAMIESLNILSGYDLAKMGDRSPQQVHLIAEAFRRAYKDRADYLGDPDFVALPIAQLASPAYAAAWRKTIDPIKPSPSATLTRPAGFLPPPPAATRAAAHESTETTHFSVVDAEGNAVANTTTLNGLFGGPARLPAQRRDGRLHRRTRRTQHVRPHSEPGQRHRAWQAPALQHDAHHRAEGRQTPARTRIARRLHHHHHRGQRHYQHP
jgi:gamma-glutamyltranspeptidase/glutathione hydrolase